ncbi:hypothetical protein [Flavobacterium sp. 140616W15]|uniref:beta strand repeat-containing protein n=1 Tax=Flavobacterium sp. 140616W15 TaxID=2478552 RepID=UPI000F0C0F6B|nr:hypothetical protein [Flavobacterium sp. 140616W15]AYN03825.1 hypothetical protein EAG11_06245 [Flavobacterium sp. 140616W15]
MKKYIILLAFIGYNSYAQTGIGTKAPDASSALDVKLPNKGVLLSRVALTGTTDTVTIPSAANSLTVYNTATTNDVTPGYYYWNTANKKWIRLLDSNWEGWGLKGNSGTDPGTNFIGTTDNKDLIFKRSNIQAGRLGDSNTSFGKSSLMNSIGINNTAIGSKALELNIGIYNTAVGFGALQKNTNGAGNTAFGAMALEKLADGGYNTGIGKSSLARLTKGIHNVALGALTLGQITAGNYNIAIGSGAGFAFMNGDNSDGFNTIVGSYDNHLIQGFYGGKNNTILGSRIRYPSNTSFSNNIIIADGEGNRRINVNELGNVGLGTNSPHQAAALEINSTNKGVLLPRVALTSATATAPLSAVTAGMIVYNTATAGIAPNNVTPGQYYHNGSQWVRVMDSFSGWSLTGNTGTVPGTNFIGTTDNNDLIFKRYNTQAGRLGATNTSFGQSSLINPPINEWAGNYNTAIGNKVLEKNTSGNFNTATGFGALQNNTINNSNSAFGYSAMENNTTGSENTAVGSKALQKNINGKGNSAFGYLAMGNSIVGEYNTAMGYGVLNNFSEGTYNVAIGMHSLYNLTKGTNNVALGSGALGQNTTGNYNIAIGSGAGANFNTTDNSDGFNTIIGSNDNYTNQGFVSGKNNTIIGSRIKYLSSSLSNNIIIADGSGNRRINVDDKGNVGLGTNTPDASAALDVTNTRKGLLMPRVPLTGTTDVIRIPSPANSLMIYNTATVGDVTPGYYYWNAEVFKWIRVTDASTPSSGWELTGNSGTIPGTNFIGTTDDNDLIFKRNKIQAGLIKPLSTAFGSEALLSVTADNYNTAFGAKTLTANTTGQVNVAVGTLALTANSTGEGNNAIGAAALYSNTEGNFNIAVGSNTLMANTLGSGNIGIGSNTLLNNSTGNENVVIGNKSLTNFITGNGNSAFGTEIGASFSWHSSASNNTFIGYKTANGISQGKANTIIGANVDIRAKKTDAPIPLSNNIIIADGDGNRRINVDDKGNVGLGTNTPHESAALEVTSSINNKGLLLPRVALTATNVAAPLSAVTAGMTVYNTATAGVVPNNVTPGVYYHTGSEWVKSSVDNLGNHTANQVLNLANNNITNAKKTDTELLTIKKGADGSLPTNGKLAMATNAQGDIVWVDPDKLPISIPAPSAIFKINTNQDILGGSIGSTSVMKAKLLASSIKSKVSFDEPTSKIKLKPGKYKIELALSLLAPDSPSGTNVHSYFVDFPGQGGRIHKNQVAMGGTISNHGINISSIAIIGNDTDWTIYLGRGQAGNYVGKTLIEGNDTSNGNYIMITQLPD